MKKNLCGNTTLVTVSKSDLRNFARAWPCFGPTDSPIKYTFDNRSGDLIDIEGDCAGQDGHGLVALGDDARDFAGVSHT